MRRRPRLTRARLHDVLRYDSKTGEFRWRKRMSRAVKAGDVAGTLRADGYCTIKIKGRDYRSHHLAWLFMTGKWCAAFIDHRDGNPSNNRWANLRGATMSQNSANRRVQRNNKCGFKGVVRGHIGRWYGTIYKNGRKHHLGTFATPQAAHAAYAAAARRLFGEFARTE